MIDAAKRDVLLIQFLRVERYGVFDGSEVGGVVLVGCGVFNLVERRGNLASRGDGGPRPGPGASEPVVTVPWACFLPQ